MRKLTEEKNEFECHLYGDPLHKIIPDSIIRRESSLDETGPMSAEDVKTVVLQLRLSPKGFTEKNGRPRWECGSLIVERKGCQPNCRRCREARLQKQIAALYREGGIALVARNFSYRGMVEIELGNKKIVVDGQYLLNHWDDL